MFVAVDAGDRSAEIDQASRSHAVLTLVHLDAQPVKHVQADIQEMANIKPGLKRLIIVTIVVIVMFVY